MPSNIQLFRVLTVLYLESLSALAGVKVSYVLDSMDTLINLIGELPPSEDKVYLQWCLDNLLENGLNSERVQLLHDMLGVVAVPNA